MLHGADLQILLAIVYFKIFFDKKSFFLSRILTNPVITLLNRLVLY
jgi:hypothetical protein